VTSLSAQPAPEGEAMNADEEKRFKKWQRKVGFRFAALPLHLTLDGIFFVLQTVTSLLNA
jgi:hypothetical protein